MSSKAPCDELSLERLDSVERLVHHTTALLLVGCLATGTILYIPAFMLAVGHRSTVVYVHVSCGFALFVPVLAGLAGPWRSGLGADLKRLSVWEERDFAYFSAVERRLRPRGKFNGGQKLATALFAAGGIVMGMSGVVMWFSPPFPINYARGATLVHDIVYLALFVLVVGHLVLAASRPALMASLVTGRVPRSYAERAFPEWVAGRDEPLSRRGASRPRRHAPRGAVEPAGKRPASG